jgi:hypothetical protein
MKMDLFLPINYKRIVPTVGSEKHCDSFARFNATAAAAAATTTDASASAWLLLLLLSPLLLAR